MSNREFPDFYQTDPRRVGGLGGAPPERRDRPGGRDTSGRGRPERTEGPGYTGRGENGFGEYQPAGSAGDGRGRPSASGRATDDAGRAAGRPGRPRSRGDQGGQAPRGRDAREEGRFRGRQDASRSRGRQPGQSAVGPRGTSASRERYAAARERYAARVGAGRAAGAAQDTDVSYGGGGSNGTGHNGNGHNGTGYAGTGYAGAGYEDAGYGGRRPGGPAGLRAPDGRRTRGRHSNGGNGDGGGGFDNDGREHRKGDWWRHWTLKKGLSVGAAAAGVMVLVATVGAGMAYAKTPIPSAPQLAAIRAASTVYFSDNRTRVGQFGTFNRQPLAYNQIPAVLRNAVVAAEDKNFWHEGGVSPTGIVRAAFNDLTSSGGSLQGGSTITQQLVRNYYANVGTAQTMTRKVKEIFVAQKLAQAKSKVWILTEYLNTVYFGAGAYGVGAAAQTYFGLATQDLSKITPAQAAMIAAMIQSPSYYSPNPKDGAAYQGLVFRWHYVLGAMADMGTLPQQTAAKAAFPKVVRALNNSWSGYRGYIMQAVQYELQHTYGYTPDEISSRGLHIVTTFSKPLMDSLYATVRQNKALMRAGTPPAPPFGARVASIGLPRFVHVGAVLERPSDGAIVAMYSGKDYNQTKWDDALQARNQVGSSFKPYVLATAVKQGMNVVTSRLNGFSPLWIPPDSQPTTFASLKDPAIASDYEVQNDEVSNPNRPVSVVEATAMSLNTSYADLWHRVALNASTGQHSVVQMAGDFGVDTKTSGLRTQRDEAGTALGQASLTVEEQANMIATLADGGVYHTPHVIKRIVAGNSVTQAKVVQRQVLTPDQAAEVDYAMSFDMGPTGTANGLGLTNGQTVIAKTGTTNLSQSAFFLGATQRYAMAVGMFVSKPGCNLPASEQADCTSTQALAFAPPSGIQTLFGVGGFAGYGGQWPAIIWHDYFMKEFNSLPAQAWPALPANFGTAWNLVPPLPKPKPRPSFCPPGQQNQGRRCRPQNQPGPLPSGLPSLPPFGGGGGGAGGAPVVGGVAAGGMVATGVLLALFPAGVSRWRRPRRRGHGPGGKRAA